MKTLILSFIALIICISGYSQSKTFVSGGSSYNIIEDQKASILNSTGYYIGIGQVERIKKWSVTGEIQFMAQRVKNDVISASTKSGNMFLYGGYQPTKLPLSILAGAQMGLIISSKITSNDTTLKETGPRFSVIGGLSYQISRFDVIAKYYRTVDGKSLFDHTFQVGVNYLLRK